MSSAQGTPTSGFAAQADAFHQQVGRRIDALAARAADGGFDEAISLMVQALEAGGVIQAFGTGHSEAFAMEIAGRAGGLIPTNRIALRDVVLYGGRLREQRRRRHVDHPAVHHPARQHRRRDLTHQRWRRR